VKRRRRVKMAVIWGRAGLGVFLVLDLAIIVFSGLFVVPGILVLYLVFIGVLSNVVGRIAENRIKPGSFSGISFGSPGRVVAVVALVSIAVVSMYSSIPGTPVERHDGQCFSRPKGKPEVLISEAECQANERESDRFVASVGLIFLGVPFVYSTKLSADSWGQRLTAPLPPKTR